MLDFLLYFIKQIGVNNSLISCRVGLFLEPIYFGDFFVVFVQNLFDVILNFLDLFLITTAHKLIFGSLGCLELTHLTFEEMIQFLQNLLLFFLMVYTQNAMLELFL